MDDKNSWDDLEDLWDIENLKDRNTKSILDGIDEDITDQKEDEIEQEDWSEYLIPDDGKKFTNFTGTDMELNELVGLKEVKEMFAKLKIQAQFLRQALKRDKDIDSWYMHMLFTGNPGVGKTTVARLVANELYECGLIRHNTVVEISRKDIVNRDSWGSILDNVNSAIEEAEGGVLFVDEAYSLISSGKKDDPGIEAMTTIMEAMETHKNNLVVILAGYKKDIQQLVEINDGIASRIGFTFDFPDYSADELTEITKRDIEKQGFIISPEALKLLNDTFVVFAGRKNLGNGRFAKKVSQNMLRKHGINLMEEYELEVYTGAIPSDVFDTISEKDVPTINEIIDTLTNKEEYSYYKDIDIKKIQEEEITNPLAFMNELNDMVGLKNIKKELKEFYTYLDFVQKHKTGKGKNGIGNLHMLFMGNPGTGKTSVARIIAKILYRVGLTHYDIFKEVSRKDLVGEHVGQTALKTAKVIQSALGGVLFIDEAYSLCSKSDQDFSKEAVDELVKAMSDYKDELVVIFAGYPQEMDNFIEMNPGIRSRIGYTFYFEDYTDKELVEIFERLIAKEGFKLSTVLVDGETVESKVKRIMHYFAGCRNLGNGRFVDNFYAIVKKKHYLNLAAKQRFEKLSDTRKQKLIETITCEDIPVLSDLIGILPSGNSFIDPQKLTEQDILNSAYHEIGHAIVSVLLTNMTIDRISTVPVASGALAYVSYKESENGKSIIPNKQDLLNRICTLMAGIAAEEVIGGIKSLGGGSDLPRARLYAEHIICAGLSKLEFKYIPDSHNNVMNGSEEYAQEVERILKEEYNRAKRIILEHKDAVVALAKTAAQEGILEQERVQELLENYIVII